MVGAFAANLCVELAAQSTSNTVTGNTFYKASGTTAIAGASGTGNVISPNTIQQ